LIFTEEVVEDPAVVQNPLFIEPATGAAAADANNMAVTGN